MLYGIQLMQCGQAIACIVVRSDLGERLHRPRQRYPVDLVRIKSVPLRSGSPDFTLVATASI